MCVQAIHEIELCRLFGHQSKTHRLTAAPIAIVLFALSHG